MTGRLVQALAARWAPPSRRLWLCDANPRLACVSGIVVVGINRPKAKNAISKNLVKLVRRVWVGGVSMGLSCGAHAGGQGDRVAGDLKVSS